MCGRDNLFGEGNFDDFLGDILEAVGEIGHLVFFGLMEFDVIRFSAFMQVFESIFLFLAKLEVLLSALLLHLDPLPAHVGTLNREFGIFFADGAAATGGNHGLLSWDYDSIASLLETEVDAGPIYLLRKQDLEI